MRLATSLMSARSPQNVNKVPFKEMMTLKLKERVSGKFDSKKEGGCLYELTMLVTCLQDNEYENKLCQKQVDNLNACYHKFRNDSFQSKRAKEKGNLVPGEKNMTFKQVRNLFRLRPLPN